MFCRSVVMATAAIVSSFGRRHVIDASPGAGLPVGRHFGCCCCCCCGGYLFLVTEFCVLRVPFFFWLSFVCICC